MCVRVCVFSADALTYSNCPSLSSRFISPSLPQLTTLELQYVSPKLMGCEDLELAVPGTYEPNQPVVHIRRVSATLNVITSKQRPRKLVIQGHSHTHTLTHSHTHTLTLNSHSHTLPQSRSLCHPHTPSHTHTLTHTHTHTPP